MVLVEEGFDEGVDLRFDVRAILPDYPRVVGEVILEDVEVVFLIDVTGSRIGQLRDSARIPVLIDVRRGIGCLDNQILLVRALLPLDPLREFHTFEFHTLAFTA
jgi:hypothetical protein